MIKGLDKAPATSAAGVKLEQPVFHFLKRDIKRHAAEKQLVSGYIRGPGAYAVTASHS